MQKLRIALLAAALMAGIAPVKAQQFNTIPSNTVIGRLGNGVAGPSSAIPFSSFLPGLIGIQSANTVYAGPSSGSAAIPAFRALVGADLPLPTTSTLGGLFAISCASHNWITTIPTTGVQPTCTQPAAADLSNGVTGSGSVVLAASPTLVTPTLGVATATSVNNVAITAPATAATLSIANNKTLTASNTLTLAGTDSTTLTFQGTDTYVGRATTDTLTNKTFDTAGTGNVFKINGTQITANTGTGSNVLATSPTITTPTIATSLTFSPTTGGIVGTTTNDSTATGNVGEAITSTILIASAVSLSNSTPANVTSISPTAGDWDISAEICFNGTGTTSVSGLRGSISTTSATENLVAPNFSAIGYASGSAALSTTDTCFAIAPIRESIASTTQFFLVADCAFSASTCKTYGSLRARRMR